MVQQKEPNLEAKILNVGASQGLVQVSWHRYNLRVIVFWNIMESWEIYGSNQAYIFWAPTGFPGLHKIKINKTNHEVTSMLMEVYQLDY